MQGIRPLSMMSTSPSTVNVGSRIRYARDLLGMNQEELKVRLGFNDRQTVSDIETGKRSVKTEELLLLSEALDRDVEFFLDPFNVAAEAQYSWRADPHLPGDELDRFEAQASGWIGMLRWLREQQPRGNNPLKFSLRLTAQSSFDQAQRSAEELVERLQLGPIPSERLADCLERELDIPVLFVETGAHLPAGYISGAACELGNLGVILINRRESRTRRSFDLAHELFHTLTWESMRPDRRESNSAEDRQGARRIEQLANAFAAALLMPQVAIDALADPQRLRDVDHLAGLARQLGVTVGALGWRLYNLKRIDGPTRSKLAQCKPVDSEHATPLQFSASFVTMLHGALESGRLSARKAAKTLGMPLSVLVALFASYQLPAPYEL